MEVKNLGDSAKPAQKPGYNPLTICFFNQNDVLIYKKN
jgi:hypothetical protein